MTPGARSILRLLCCVAAGGLIISGTFDAPSAAEPAPDELAVSGSIDGLYPGSAGVLVVRVSSTFDHSVVVDSLTARSTPAGAGCERHVRVADMIGERIVPPNGNIEVGLTTTFDFSAPDACQNTVIPLVFTINGAEAAEAPPVLEPGADLPTSGSSSRVVALIAGAAFAVGAGLLGLERRRAR
jgi:hypothetical protein